MNIKQNKTVTMSLLLVGTLIGSTAQAATYAVDEDVMTSAFFGGEDKVRGYAGDARPTFRVATDEAFGVGPETIYLDFSSIDLSVYTGPITATLTMQSKDGEFGANAGAGNPFTVSAQGVNANPLTSITDDTNPGGAIGWFDFFSNNILAADAAALTAIDGFGSFTFDVTALVSDWISGANTLQFVAMTGNNDTSGNDFLHGFANNTEAPGSTYLTVSAVPVPAAVWLFGSGLLGLVGVARRKSQLKTS